MVTEVTYHDVPTRQPGNHESEVVRATVDTGTGGGGGPLTVTLAGDYGAEPIVSADCVSHSADVNISSKTVDSLDVNVANGPASTTVTVELVVRGEHGVS